MEFTSSSFFSALARRNCFLQGKCPMEFQRRETDSYKDKRKLTSIYFLNAILEKAFILAIPPCMGGARGGHILFPT